MSEQQYDAEIAPELLRLANKCKELGMSFTATVEYEPGARGTTVAGIEDNNMDMVIAYWAGRYGGRLDDLLLAVSRRIRDLKLPHSCICLMQFGVPCSPDER
jgi:hypothetical protein